MKSILLSIRPKWVSKILNGEKTIEVRKRFPKEYKGWVYIYCTKGKPYLANGYELFTNKYSCLISDEDIYKEHKLNGKVVARFYCDKVEEIKWKDIEGFYTNEVNNVIFEDKCQLTYDELCSYFEDKNNLLKLGYAIHISRLEIFDKPKELREFDKVGSYNNPTIKCNKKEQGRCNYGVSPFTGKWSGCEKARLTKAPQNYCYVEVEE